MSRPNEALSRAAAGRPWKAAPPQHGGVAGGEAWGFRPAAMRSWRRWTAQERRKKVGVGRYFGGEATGVLCTCARTSLAQARGFLVTRLPSDCLRPCPCCRPSVHQPLRGPTCAATIYLCLPSAPPLIRRPPCKDAIADCHKQPIADCYREAQDQALTDPFSPAR